MIDQEKLLTILKDKKVNIKLLCACLRLSNCLQEALLKYNKESFCKKLTMDEISLLREWIE